MLEDYHIILASNSPRRRQLLAGLDLDFEVRVFLAGGLDGGTVRLSFSAFNTLREADAFAGCLSEVLRLTGEM